MRVDMPFAVLSDLLEANNIRSEGAILTLPKEDFHRLSIIVKQDIDYSLGQTFIKFNEMTINGIKIKPRYGS